MESGAVGKERAPHATGITDAMAHVYLSQHLSCLGQSWHMRWCQQRHKCNCHCRPLGSLFSYANDSNGPAAIATCIDMLQSACYSMECPAIPMKLRAAVISLATAARGENGQPGSQIGTHMRRSY